MYGICQEGCLIGLFDQVRKGKKEAAGQLNEIQAAAPQLLWMETDNLLADLRQQTCERDLGESENAVIFLRLVELICLEGFASQCYQQLIAEPPVRRAVMQECSAEAAERFKSLSPISPKCGGSYFFDAETYLTAEGFLRLRAGRDLLALAGVEALAWFVEMFFTGEGTLSETAGPMPDELREVFPLLARLVMVAISSETNSYRRRALMERLFHGERRFGNRAVDDIDLWLQRRAFMSHVRRHPEWGERYHSPVRPLLYAYFSVMTRLERKKRQALATEIEESLHLEDLWLREGVEAVALLRRL